jgi:uncharacterized repeat protein (TIGR01451 family)
VSNTGNVDLQNMVVSDPRIGAGLTCSAVSIGGTLRVGESTVCRGRYITTNQDILNGGTIVNTASVVTSRTTVRSASASVNVEQTAMFTIVKRTNVSVVDAAGQSIFYTIEVQNTGTRNLTNFQVSDPLVDSSSGQRVTCVPSLGGLLPAGVLARCSASYVVTQSDINAGRDLVNVATAQFAEIGPQSAEVSTSVRQVPSLLLTKTVNPSTAVSAANTRLTYTVIVRKRSRKLEEARKTVFCCLMFVVCCLMLDV